MTKKKQNLVHLPQRARRGDTLESSCKIPLTIHRHKKGWSYKPLGRLTLVEIDDQASLFLGETLLETILKPNQVYSIYLRG
ncbi:unnamed protein product [Arabidopsis halleri]